MLCRASVLAIVLAAPAAAQPLTLDRIFASDEFRGQHGTSVKWLPGGGSTTLAPAKGGGSDIVRVDAAGKREVLVPANKLVPPDAKQPLAIHGYELSKDRDVVLIYTNSVKVWRANTRGDYWTFRRSTGALAKIGSDAPASSLMFAKLSPDGARVGYVRGNKSSSNRRRRPGRQAHHGRLERDHQRHLRLGIRRGVLLPGRLAVEPGRQADRLLATRYLAASRPSP